MFAPLQERLPKLRYFRLEPRLGKVIYLAPDNFFTGKSQQWPSFDRDPMAAPTRKSVFSESTIFGQWDVARMPDSIDLTCLSSEARRKITTVRPVFAERPDRVENGRQPVYRGARFRFALSCRQANGPPHACAKATGHDFPFPKSWKFSNKGK